MILAIAESVAGDDIAPIGNKTVGFLGIAGQGFHQEGQGFSEFATVALTGSRPISRRAEALLEFHPAYFERQPRIPPHGPRETVGAFAFEVGVRIFVGPLDGPVHPYAEILDGVFYGYRRIPARGSTFNFLSQAGFGLLLRSGRRWHPYVESRWVHISNAGTGHHNPDWDHWAIAIGSRMSFPD